MKKRIQTLLLAGVMAAAAGTALAYSPGMMGHEGMSHRDPARMEKMHAKHLGDLKAKLQITAAQEAAWNTFAEAMKPPMGMAGQQPDRAALDKLSTPERLDQMRALHKERMAAMDATMEKHSNAIKALYAALTPAQQKVFDAEHARMGMHSKGKHRMHSGDMDHGKAPAKP